MQRIVILLALVGLLMGCAEGSLRKAAFVLGAGLVGAGAGPHPAPPAITRCVEAANTIRCTTY